MRFCPWEHPSSLAHAPGSSSYACQEGYKPALGRVESFRESLSHPIFIITLGCFQMAIHSPKPRPKDSQNQTLGPGICISWRPSAPPVPHHPAATTTQSPAVRTWLLTPHPHCKKPRQPPGLLREGCSVNHVGLCSEQLGVHICDQGQADYPFSISVLQKQDPNFPGRDCIWFLTDSCFQKSFFF